MKPVLASPRSLPVIALLLLTAFFLNARGRREQVPVRVPLSDFPAQIAGGSSRDLGIGADIREVLGAGDFLSRTYSRPGEPVIDLFVGYFPSQRTGSTIHSPKNCLPGAGWSPVESGRIELTPPGHAPVSVNRYIIAKGLDRQLVLYWYQSSDRIIASEYWAKFFLIADAITRNRTDGALVRLATPIAGNESAPEAERRTLVFAQHVVASLNRHIPR